MNIDILTLRIFQRSTEESIILFFAQAFTDFAVVVVNGGSTDGSAYAVQPYLERIEYVEQENRDPGADCNRSIELSRASKSHYWYDFNNSAIYPGTDT